MRWLAVLLLATCGLTAPAAAATGSALSCVDTPLRVHFAGAQPQLGTSGTITVRREDGTVADRIDLADPATALKPIGDAVSDTGGTHLFHYQPVILDDTGALVTLHHRLDYRQSYTVTVDAGVFPGYPALTWRFRTKPGPPRDDAHLTVAADGSGDFCTVQGAIDQVPEGNQRPVRIDVRPGTYQEIDYVRADRAHVTVAGEDRERTVIAYANDDHLNGDAALANGGPADVCPKRALPAPDVHNCWRALFGVDAPDFTLRDLTLHNLTPYGGSQAEAFRGNNDRIALRNVTLLSFQDTLRLQGTGFVTDSFVQGDVDFVWGTGAVYVQRSTLESMHAGYVTQIRNDAGHHGDVFVDVRLTRAPGVPDGSVYLGRIQTDRFPASQVVFLDSAMDGHITPVGWQITPDDCALAPALQDWEYHSTDLAGHPLDTSARLPCSHQLTGEEAARWRDPSFVLNGWDPR